MKNPNATLTFAWLYSRVQEYVAITSRSGPSRIERWAFWIAMTFAGLGFVIANTWSHWLSPTVALWIVRACLWFEIAGFVVVGIFWIRRELPQFLKPRRVHAEEMDDDYDKWLQLIAELQLFSPDQRQQRLRFVQRLRTNMDHRMGLAFGGTQKLGLFPVLIALYLQFRNWKWGDWAAAFDVNLVGALLICLLLLLYAAGWLLVGLRTRLDTYVALLEESLEAHGNRAPE